MLPSLLPKCLAWRGSSKADFMEFPREVQREMGYALFLAQMGGRHAVMAKTLKGFRGGSVIEIRENASDGAYRAVYTVRYADTVYVLHAFQKKSKKGIEMAKLDRDTIERRLDQLIAERKTP
jgi:phage-related protein